MSLKQMYALLWRHLVAVAAILALTAATAWDIKTTPMVYAESANVIFTAPGPNPYATLGTELVPAANLMTQTMQSPASRQHARQAGATATFSFGLVNLYNQQFPFYNDPYVTVTAQSTSAAETSQTFQIVLRIFRNLVVAKQAQAGVQSAYFIRTHVVGNTGPFARPGSRKRALGGLVLLALMALFTIIVFLDRHPAEIIWRPTRYRSQGVHEQRQKAQSIWES